MRAVLRVVGRSGALHHRGWDRSIESCLAKTAELVENYRMPLDAALSRGEDRFQEAARVEEVSS